jgi:hypothetical protein
MVVVADHPRHLPGAVPEQPEVEESRHSVAIFRFAAVVDVKVVFTRQDRPVNRVLPVVIKERGRY